MPHQKIWLAHEHIVGLDQMRLIVYADLYLSLRTMQYADGWNRLTYFEILGRFHFTLQFIDIVRVQYGVFDLVYHNVAKIFNLTQTKVLKVHILSPKSRIINNWNTIYDF